VGNIGGSGEGARSNTAKNRQRRLKPRGFRRFFLLFLTVIGFGWVLTMNSNVAALNKLQTLIVIGNGMVGHHCVEQLIERGALDHYRLHVFSEEPMRAYDRVHLSEYFGGRDAESLALGEASLYQTPGVTLHLGVPVLEIDRARRQVITAQGCVSYDKLVLATGSYPFVPPIEGAEGDSRLVYRTLEDLDAIRAAAANARRGVVVGGGLLGLEAANALKSLGLEAHVVEFAPRLMPVQLDEQGGLALKAQIERLGVGVHLSRGTQSISAGEQYRYRMNFANDEFLEADLIVFSAGIRAQDALARHCALDIGPRGGVVIDDQCLTSDPNIYAIGECAAWNGSLFGLVAPGYQMARGVATLLCNQVAEPFQGADMSTKLKLLGVDVGSIGDAHAQTPGARSYQFIDEATASYRRLVVDADSKRVLGAVLVGDNSYYDTLLQYMQNGIALPSEPASLILPSSTGVPTLGPGALPESATVCSCHNVTKGSICSAIDGGCTDLGLLKSQTKACTGCGGCAGLLKQVFEHELIARGVSVDKSLCEHFAYTRQELYALVRVEGVITFEELLAKHGRGHTGCDV
jgi:nitrite reductase (NADH) large subunit